MDATIFKGAIIWNNLPNHFKEAKSLPEFKTLIREWTVFMYCCIYS